uniref:hypothetical protein n=1 Tax=Vaginimicrobium propionicum TaxID=1871034 RepID=UPI0012EC4ABC|nr:hypothetical protein [Vaginimicrobium propionicum]
MTLVRCNRKSWAFTLCVIFALLLSGCAPKNQGAALSQTDTEWVADQLNEAVKGKSLDLATLFDDSQPDWLASNLKNLAQINFTAGGAGRLTARWRPGPDDEDAWHEVQVAARCSNKLCKITKMSPLEGQPAPIWLSTPIDVVTLGDLTVLGRGVERWVGAGQQGIETASKLSQALKKDWDGRLIIQIVPTQPAFHAVTGTADFDDDWAITWRQDFANPGSPAAMAIVVNDVLSLGREGLQSAFLIAHESVHVATGGLGEPVKGRKWVLEGLAESLALNSFPQMAEASTALLRQHCDLVNPPGDEELLSSDPDTRELAYARAAMTVRLLNGDDNLIRELWTNPDTEIPETALVNDAC